MDVQPKQRSSIWSWTAQGFDRLPSPGTMQIRNYSINNILYIETVQCVCHKMLNNI